VRLCDLTGKREAESRSFRSAAQRIVGAKELLKDFFFAAPGDAGTAVAHHHFAAPGMVEQFQFNFLALVRIFFSVREQVYNHLRDGIAIRFNGDRMLGEYTPEREPFFLEVWTEGLANLTDDLHQVTILNLPGALTALQPGKIEDVIDQAGQA